MGLTRRRVIQIVACAAMSPSVAALAGEGRALRRWEGFALGAACSIVISGGRPEESEAALAAAVAEIHRIEALFSLYRSDSDLMRLNRKGRLENPSPDMVALLGLCDAVNRMTAGRFDPTVQPLWRLLADTAGKADEAALASARSLIGWKDVLIESRAVAFSRLGMAITLNGIAQGYATDRVAEVLRRHGCSNLLVDIGEIAALGERAPGRPWRIGVAARGDSAPEAEVELTDLSIATSSPRGTVLDADARIGHIIDPTPSGTPKVWRRISVIHSSAALADGLSTAFCLMDRKEIEAVASAAGVRVLLASSD